MDRRLDTLMDVPDEDERRANDLSDATSA